MSTRTQDEIIARIAATRDVDPLGWRMEVLADSLTFESAQDFLKEDSTQEQWGQPPTVEELTGQAKEYCEFAVGKILNHRGISANRSVDKLTEFAWLLGRDDIVKAMDDADYPQYGAPKVKAFAVGFGWWDGEPGDRGDELARMAEGLPCTDNCGAGCQW